MNIIKEKITPLQRILVFGPAGVGKSMLAGHMPRPVFIDIEESMDHKAMAPLPRPKSWAHLVAKLIEIEGKHGTTL